MDFPCLDFSEFEAGDKSRSDNFAQDLVKHFELYGFASICNHGMSEQAVNDLFTMVCLFI
jgi:isopenicillin N synthase-like dioxygenase